MAVGEHIEQGAERFPFTKLVCAPILSMCSRNTKHKPGAGNESQVLDKLSP